MTERQAPYVTRPKRETMIHHFCYCPACGVSYAAAFPMTYCPECGRAFEQTKGIEHVEIEAGKSIQSRQDISRFNDNQIAIGGN